MAYEAEDVFNYEFYLASKLKKKGENLYAWLVGFAPAPIKGRPQKYLIYKIHKPSLRVYESVHTYSLGLALMTAQMNDDFAMTKSKKKIGDVMNEAHIIACESRNLALSATWARLCEIRRYHNNRELIIK